MHIVELHNLVENNENEKLEAIIGMKPHYAQLQNPLGWTLLCIAAICKNVSYIDVLVKRCQLQQENEWGDKPIHDSAQCCEEDFIY